MSQNGRKMMKKWHNAAKKFDRDLQGKDANKSVSLHLFYKLKNVFAQSQTITVIYL